MIAVLVRGSGLVLGQTCSGTGTASVRGWVSGLRGNATRSRRTYASEFSAFALS
ncbi:hypothetical protein [Rubidibacter lacunae]|uniref:hypothetical protein n=1 Tax=Rubidibacter lacunae TaxID=582514 RepID=UPI00041B3288|nr:hypothetical protein [Rubidibacter lacunae]